MIFLKKRQAQISFFWEKGIFWDVGTFGALRPIVPLDVTQSLYLVLSSQLGPIDILAESHFCVMSSPLYHVRALMPARFTAGPVQFDPTINVLSATSLIMS